ncbi:hypothetical protein CK203_113462 [Vitis vinifera]|uniref:Uncharacterized protein n=1 Tax=Vitis vinifera TaxID=29760 RepID=A0A438CQ10_VITVI|nr:hypothetical protein CK203_113462 [Vitis vinifera]
MPPLLSRVKTHNTTCNCKFATVQDPTREGEQSGCEGVVLSMSPVKDSVHLMSHHRRHQSSTLQDVSFNNLVGEIPNDISSAKALNFIYLSSNLLSGNVPDLFLKKGSSMNLNLNLYRSSSMENNLRAVLPCSRNVNCPRFC